MAFGTSRVTTSVAVGIVTVRSRSAKMPQDPVPGRGACGGSTRWGSTEGTVQCPIPISREEADVGRDT